VYQSLLLAKLRVGNAEGLPSTDPAKLGVSSRPPAWLAVPVCRGLAVAQWWRELLLHSQEATLRVQISCENAREMMTGKARNDERAGNAWFVKKLTI
jgi:hypothetical protein